MSDARNLGETAFVRERGQPSAEIVRVECVKCTLCHWGILECTNLGFCECLVRNAHFGRSLCEFLRMSRTKRSFWKVSFSVLANVSYETLILEGLFVSFCECLVQNAHFGRSLCQFLRMSRTKRSFWAISLSVFANVSYEPLILEGLFVSFCECLVRNAHLGRSLCQFLRMSRTKRSFWEVSL